MPVIYCRRSGYENREGLTVMTICPYCGWEIDIEVCWCGDDMSTRWHDGHSAVPLGCTCGYCDADKMKNPNYKGTQ